MNLINLIKKNYQSIGVYNENVVKNKLKVWHNYLPFITPYYAIKSFSHQFILNTFSKEERIGFDVASKREMNWISNFKNPIIYSHPVKSSEDILYAKKKGIKRIVCDSETEIQKLIKIYPDCDIIWRIKSCEEFSTIKFNKKFGACISSTTKVLKKDYNIKGISFHVGSYCKNVNAYFNTLDSIKNHIHPHFIKNDKKLELIDIGGGFIGIDDIKNLNGSFQPFLKFIKSNNIEVISEPGRYFSNDCVTLYSKVIGVKTMDDCNHIYINDSIYSSFSGKIFDHQNFIPHPLYKSETEIRKPSIIWGQTCDSADLIMENVRLPFPKVGDIIKWERMGAYSFSSAVQNFNGFPKCKLVKLNPSLNKNGSFNNSRYSK